MEIRQSIRSKADLGKHDTLYTITKRVADIVISSAALLIMSPLFIVVSYRILKRDGKPVFEKETVAGKRNRLYTIWRFRTMTIPSKVIRSLPPHPFPEEWSNGVPDSFHFKRSAAQTVTFSGKWIKKYRLENLPALYNVLKGDMSLVGPEPEIAEVVDHYNKHQAVRLMVKPGITGFAQVNGSTNLNHTQKIRDDLFYIEKRSIKFDLIIFSRAIRQIFKQ
ncbi:sugar transferase [Virgibacillus kekensis]|uniref:Sugar transferase n=1 Tax=Virgibacillus kekensis TaxID=202261 RepID=A0ABV9DDS4_9BACI